MILLYCLIVLFIFVVLCCYVGFCLIGSLLWIVVAWYLIDVVIFVWFGFIVCVVVLCIFVCYVVGVVVFVFLGDIVDLFLYILVDLFGHYFDCGVLVCLNFYFGMWYLLVLFALFLGLIGGCTVD